MISREEVDKLASSLIRSNTGVYNTGWNDALHKLREILPKEEGLTAREKWIIREFNGMGVPFRMKDAEIPEEDIINALKKSGNW